MKGCRGLDPLRLTHLLQMDQYLCPCTRYTSTKRTWLVGNATDIKTLAVCEECIALDLNWRELSLALTGGYARECGRCSAQKGDDDGGLHSCGRRKKEVLKRW